MGLDVYVGSLTRYYSGNWETVAARAAREVGVEFQVIRHGSSADDPDGREEVLTDPGQIAAAVNAWRTTVSDALGQPLDWVEDVEAPYFTDKPAWDGYGSLQVLTASVECGEQTRPAVGVEQWSENDVWRRATEAKRPRFAHFYFPELWLPVDLEYVFEAGDLAGNRIAIGSSIRLLDDLRAINEATFVGAEDDFASWRANGAEHGGPFEDTARFGLAVFLELGSKSVEQRLPIRLDY